MKALTSRRACPPLALLAGVLFVCAVARAQAAANDALPFASLPAAPRMIAEWEPALGTLVRWPLGIPMSLAVELAQDDLLFTLVNDAGAEADAAAAFASAGIDLARVRFIRVEIYSWWTRDWGPQGAFDAGGDLVLVDPVFEGYPWVPGCASPESTGAPAASRLGRTRHDVDDAIPGAVADALQMPLQQLDVILTGGNVMTDGHGTAWSTRQMLDENAASVDAGTFFSRVQNVLGIEEYHVLDNPEVFGIQHIDCYAKLLDEETVLVKQLPADHPEYACTEAIAAHFAAATTCFGRGFRVERIWCPPYSGDAVAAYTNSLLLNGKVLVPTFGIAADDAALETYRRILPGHEVIGFPHPGAWFHYDALHCRTLGIFDPMMLRLSHARADSVRAADVAVPLRLTVDDHSRSGLADWPRVWWTIAGTQLWQSTPMTSADGRTFDVTLPPQPAGAEIRYYVSATSLSGRTETLPRTAPAATYGYRVEQSTSVVGALRLDLTVAPNPFNPRTEIGFELPREQRGELTVHDLRGQRVAVLASGVFPRGRRSLSWDGTDTAGHAVASGTYFVRLRTDDALVVRKVSLVR